MPSDDSGIGSSVKTDLMHFIMFTAYRPSGGHLYAILVSNLCTRTTSIPSICFRELYDTLLSGFSFQPNFYRIMHIPNQCVSNVEKIFWPVEERIK